MRKALWKSISRRRRPDGWSSRWGGNTARRGRAATARRKNNGRISSRGWPACRKTGWSSADKLKEYTDQIAKSLGIGHGLIGRWEQFFDEKRINRVEPAGRQAGVFLQQMRLGEALAESGAKLQGCVHSIDVVWVEQTTDAEHTWQVINRQQLYRDEISSRAFFTYRYVDALHGIRVGTRAKVLHEPIVLPKAD